MRNCIYTHHIQKPHVHNIYSRTNWNLGLGFRVYVVGTHLMQRNTFDAAGSVKPSKIKAMVMLNA